MLKIYGNKTFNAVKVVMTAEELGLDYEYQVIDFASGEMKSPEFMKIHPLGKIPAMEHDGNAIFESNNMCRYLANISGKKLYSDDPLQAAKIDETVDLIAHHIGKWITTYFFEEIVKKAFYEKEPNADALAEAAGFLAQQLPYLDGMLDGNDFLCGNEVTIADCVAFAMIMAHEYTSFDISDHSNLTRWYDQMKARPSYAAMLKHFPGGYNFG
jgi:glutathione S-transferase